MHHSDGRTERQAAGIVQSGDLGLRQRAEDGRRSISREVEYILELGLAAAKAKEADFG